MRVQESLAACALAATLTGSCGARFVTADPATVAMRNQQDWTVIGAPNGSRDDAVAFRTKDGQAATLPAAQTAAPLTPVRSQRIAAPTPPAFAAAQAGGKRLAVLEFQGKNIDEDVLTTFSDTVRGGALQGLEGHGVVVMTRENMLVLLKDMGKQECAEGDCEVETARNIGADYVVSGKVVRIERIYVVTLKLHETQRGSLLGTNTVEAAHQVELLRALREHGRQLITAAFGPRPVSVRSK